MKRAKKQIDICDPYELRAALNFPNRPTIVWQEPFDYFRGHCKRIASPENRTDLFDFMDYFLDYQYMEVQRDLLEFAFPIAFEGWARQTLQMPLEEKFSGEWSFEGMWDTLEYRPVSPEFFNGEQIGAMKIFFMDILLKLMSKETELTFYGSNASAYEWMQIHATLVWQFPVVEAIWEKW